MKCLAKTPDMLPVLKQAGVVDAGGQGFLIILGGWIAVLAGEAVPSESLTEAGKKTAPSVQETQEIPRDFMRIETLDYPYCTEFMVKGNDLLVEPVSYTHLTLPTIYSV